MSNGSFDFNLFLRESKETLLNPKSYFSAMNTSGGMAEPLIKAVIYGAIAGVFGLLWNILGLGMGGSMFGSAVGFMAFIWSIFAAVVGLFIGAVIVLVISSICKGNTDYEACARVTAAVMVIMPVTAFFGFADGISIYLGLTIKLAINIFSLWLLFNGLVYALKAKPETAKIVMYVLVALLVLMMLAGLGAKRKLEKFNNSDMNEWIKDME